MAALLTNFNTSFADFYIGGDPFPSAPGYNSASACAAFH
jgi:hypothetical protein